MWAYGAWLAMPYDSDEQRRITASAREAMGGTGPQQEVVSQAERTKFGFFSWVLLAVLVLVLLFGVHDLYVWYVTYDTFHIDDAVEAGLDSGGGRGARLPVKLWRGERILVIESAQVMEYPKENGSSGPPRSFTRISCDVIDPATGKQDPKYATGVSVDVAGAVKLK